jgi:hypothetical protein
MCLLRADRLAWGIGAVLLLAHAAGAHAAGAQSTTEFLCDGLIVRSITIERSNPPEIVESVPRLLRGATRLAVGSNSTHPAAVRPFVLLKEGKQCSERLRSESERVLRAQTYLADAEITVIPDEADGVHIVVRTVDEIAHVIGGRIADGSLSGIGVGSNNFGGQGVRGVASWNDGGGYRDGLRAELALAHTFGLPHRARAMIERQPLDNRVHLSWERPFWSTAQKTGWYLGTDNVDGYARFVRPDERPIGLPYDARRFDAGGVARIGGDRAGLFAGPFVTFERFRPGSPVRRIGADGLGADADSTLVGRFSALESSRALLIVGGRFLDFVRAEGLDALEGPQDIGRGLQVVFVGGNEFGGGPARRYTGGEVFAGAGTPQSYLAMRGFWERVATPGAANEMLVSGRIRWYQKLSDTELWTLSAEFTGGWNQPRPYQLRVANPSAGLRGFTGSEIAGAHRAVVRGDYRRLIGGWRQHATLAWSTFVDVGSLERGDVAYGQTTGTQASIGAALLAAVPRQSRSVWRLETAFPLGTFAPSTMVVRVGVSAPWREFWREPRDVDPARAVLPPTSLFGFP